MNHGPLEFNSNLFFPASRDSFPEKEPLLAENCPEKSGYFWYNFIVMFDSIFVALTLQTIVAMFSSSIRGDITLKWYMHNLVCICSSFSEQRMVIKPMGATKIATK